MTHSHTPGPWRLEHSNANVTSPIWIGTFKSGTDKVDEIVCIVDWDKDYRPEIKAKRLANARLIADAPRLAEMNAELVDALRRIEAFCASHDQTLTALDRAYFAKETARAVLAKAAKGCGSNEQP